MEIEGLVHFIMRVVMDCFMTLVSTLSPRLLSLVEVAIKQAVEMSISMNWFVNLSALSCVVQVETEEDSLSQEAFNQLEDKLK